MMAGGKTLPGTGSTALMQVCALSKQEEALQGPLIQAPLVLSIKGETGFSLLNGGSLMLFHKVLMPMIS